jgi:hypothetical protein
MCDGRLSRLADEFFVRERAVGFGSIEEGDAAIDRGANQRDHLCLIAGRTVARAHAHTAEPEWRNFQSVPSERARLHFGSLSSPA